MPHPDRPKKIDVGITLGTPGHFDDDSPAQWKAWLKSALPDEKVDLGVAFLIDEGFEVSADRDTVNCVRRPNIEEPSLEDVCTRDRAGDALPSSSAIGGRGGEQVRSPCAFWRAVTSSGEEAPAAISGTPRTRGVHYLQIAMWPPARRDAAMRR